MEHLDGILNNLVNLSVTYGLKLVLAIATLLVGLWLIKVFVRILGKTLDKNKVEPTLGRFLRSLLSSLLKVMLIITVVSMVGVEMTSFMAILAAAGLA
ncbi:MAG: mechanosensitive ion channel family protein, partial [Bacteroidales bacterium]